MAILSAYGLYDIVNSLKIHKKHFVYIMIVLTILVIPTNVYTYFNYFQFKDNVENFYSAPFYLSDSELSVLHWLQRNTETDDVILADPKFSSYVPRISGNKVYIGHWAQTIEYNKKLKWYLSANLTMIERNQLRGMNINYVITDKTIKNLDLVFSDGQLGVYRV